MSCTSPPCTARLFGAGDLRPCDASCLAPGGGLRPATYATIFRLIAATGLRRSEALHLRCSPVNLDGVFLTVRNTKLRKSRHVPIPATVVAKLRRYLAVRARPGALTDDSPCCREAEDQ
ncbi:MULTISPECIES: tyrosine-type recombinase/integrase [unclassified Mesorhizobium]|uniref:tyrosine-type recombinase/integrase n=1 Tax=unclassified Mesorhizobium TaxID=325217 RepID=UPI0033374D62